MQSDDDSANGSYRKVEGALVSGATAAAVTGAVLPLAEVGNVLAAGLSPTAVLVASLGISALQHQIEGRRSAVVQDAATMADLTLEEVLEQVLSNEQKALAFGLTMDAAARTTAHEKMRLLSHALTNILIADSPDAVDRERVYLETVSRIEPPHIRVLQRVWDLEKRCGDSNDAVSEVELATLFRSEQEAAQFLLPLLQTLESSGLLWKQGIGSNYENALRETPGHPVDTSTWMTTSHGSALLDRLHSETRLS